MAQHIKLSHSLFADINNGQPHKMETADKSFHKGANDLMAELLTKAKLTFMIVVGGVLQGLGMSLFLFPHDIPTGGAAGIAVLLHYLFQIPHGFSVWAVNVSMLLPL